MTTVTVTDTQYNITVSDTANTVTVGTGGDVNVTVNTQTISTAISNTGSGAGVGKAIVSDTLQLRKIKTSGNDLTITEGTDDIDIVLANPISVNVTGTVSSIANHDTDALAEGSSNLYFTDARHDTRARAYLQGVHNADIYPDSSGVRTLGNVLKNYAGIYVDNIFADTLQTVDGTGAFVVKNNIEPVTDDALDLGSTTKRFRDLYLGPGSLYVNNQKVLEDDSGTIKVSSTNNLSIQSGGDLTLLSSNNTSTLQDTTINLGPSANNGTTNVRGTLDVVTKIEMGDTDITSGLIHHDATNGNLELRTNGTGYIHANTADFYVGPVNGAVKIDENSIGVTAGTLTVTGNLVGSVTGQVSDISNHLLDEDDMSTDSATKAPSQQSVKAFVASQILTKDNTDEITEGSSNLYFTTARARASISASGSLAYNSGTGALTYTQGNTDTVSEGSSNLYFTNARARSAISLSSSNVNELSYDSSTGVITYTSPSTVAASGQIVFDVRNASGIDIARGDAVYISGHSGTKILVAKADANVASTMPAIGLANSAMSNNSDGSVLIGGEMTSLDTSAFSVGDILYVSETAGELTATRPSAEATKIQNIGKVARSDNQNGIIIVVGSGRANDVPNLTSGHVFIGDGAGYETRALDTSDVAEDSSNLYFTNARARAAISENSTQLAYNNSTGVLTYTQGNTDTVSEGSSNLYHTTARAISAVEGESTLALGGAVTVTGLLTANDTLKVDDGFTQTSFNPYGAGNDMPTTVAGIGQDEGWASLHVRSRGEHDFGIGSQYNLIPRALMVLSAGRKDSGSDDYLNNNDTFGAVMYNPYSGYRTGTEWLTPSATIYGVATEDHSASGMGTRLDFSTTENTNKAGAADLAHTNGVITFQGTTVTSSATLKIDDDLQVTGDIGNNGSAVDFDDNIKITGNVSSKTTTIGDFDSSGSPAYAMSGIQLDAGDTAWPTVVFKEYAGADGGGLKPVNLFTNPGFETEVFGGTPASPAALGDAKRILAVNGNAADSATLPGLANIRILGQTVGTQSGSNRGSEFIFQTTPANETTIRETLKLTNGNKLIIGEGGHDSGHGIIQANGGDLKLGDRLDTAGNNILNSSGDVTVDDNLKVNTNLTVDGNTVLGNANTDTITANGKFTAVNGFVNTILDTATANYLAGLGLIDEGAMAYISDGNAGGKCLAFYDGSNWKKAHAPGDNISSS